MTIQITDWHDLDSLRNELGKRNVSAELTTDLTDEISKLTPKSMNGSKNTKNGWKRGRVFSSACLTILKTDD